MFSEACYRPLSTLQLWRAKRTAGNAQASGEAAKGPRTHVSCRGLSRNFRAECLLVGGVQHFNFRVIFNHYSLLNTRNIFIVNSNHLLVWVCISVSYIFVPSIFWNLITNCSLHVIFCSWKVKLGCLRAITLLSQVSINCWVPMLACQESPM